MFLKSGFTLVEIMVVVVIIGILAVVAIPRFNHYRIKAKQTEVKVNLKSIYTSELSYFSEKHQYTDMIAELSWTPIGVCGYRYSVGGDFAGNPNPGGNPMGSDTAGADDKSFTAVGWANIDGDGIIDTWNISSNYVLTNKKDDTIK